MNIREQLLKENSLTNALAIAQFASSSESNFNELMQCFLSNEYRVAQRAAWVVSHAAAKKCPFVKDYIKDMVAQLARKDVHIAVIRNSVRILQKIEIPEEYHADVMNACFAFVENPATPVAVKAFSLTTLNNLSKFYPEIKAELKLIIEERWDSDTAAFRSRAKQILQSGK